MNALEWLTACSGLDADIKASGANAGCSWDEKSLQVRYDKIQNGATVIGVLTVPKHIFEKDADHHRADILRRIGVGK